jgi:acyl carrier protein
MTKSITEILKEDVLYAGLELADLGIDMDEITENVTIIGDDGLALDSVDALEIVSLLKRPFNIDVETPNKEFFEDHLGTFDRLVAFVERSAVKVAA